VSGEPRSLTYDVNTLRFAWLITSREIEVYELDGLIPVKRVGLLTTMTDDGTLEFEQAAFEGHCDWFLSIAGAAEIIEGG
jgi:hypothetical protein